MRAQVRLLPDGRRLHLHDGPIDLIVEAFGAPSEISSAYHAAAQRFQSVLDELCRELTLLRERALWNSPKPSGPVAQRMMQAVMPFASDCFITPMAAVAGSVAEEILSSMLKATTLERAYVNNGGDIALHLAADQTFTVGMVTSPDRPSLFGSTTIRSTQSVRGIATSGWRGRSFSLGIADAVTVLASSAAAADAAATVIANAVDLPGHPSITRIPANQLAPDSDLRDRLVTCEVGYLTGTEIGAALEAGVARAELFCGQNLIRAAALSLRGEVRTTAGKMLYA